MRIFTFFQRDKIILQEIRVKTVNTYYRLFYFFDNKICNMISIFLIFYWQLYKNRIGLNISNPYKLFIVGVGLLFIIGATMSKEYLEITKQLELFKKRGMIVENEEKALEKLVFINYYKLKETSLPFLFWK